MADTPNKFRRPSLFYRAKPPAAPQPRRDRPVLRFFGRALRRVCLGIGALVLISVLIGAVAAARMETGTVSLPSQMVLYFKLDGGFVENQSDGLSFGQQATPLRDVVDAIDLAARDKRVKGIVAEWAGGMTDLAQLEEIRSAILRFRRDSGKFTYIYGEDFSGGTGSYYLASSFSQIWMQPMGLLSLPGIRAEMPYARGLMDKVGVTPQFFARGQYKNLFESFELNKMSPATEESMSSLLGDLGGTLLNGIAADRHKNLSDVKTAVDMGLMTDTEALQKGYIDHLGYRDALLEGLRLKLVGDKDAEDKLPFIPMPRYARAMRKEQDAAAAFSDYPHVALVYAVGEISSGSEHTEMHAAYGTGSHIAGDDLSGDIREVARDKDIKIIVLRVDSPGGSPTASETIRRAVVYAQGRGKKVYVSMGGAAASGGYWISTSADRIYALPLTLTGSIGVAGGKVALNNLWDKIGVHWDGVGIGQNAGLQSMNQPYSDTERARMNDMFDHIYQGFIQRVSDGRRMTLAQADKIARGRVWSGHQGLGLHLVDRMGGLDVVLNDVAKELGQPDRFHLNVEIRPEPQSTLERVVDFLQNQTRLGIALKSQADLIQPFMPVLQRMNEATDPNALTYDPITVH